MTLSAFSPLAHDDDAADYVTLSVVVGNSAPHLWAECDAAHVFDRDRCPVVDLQHQLLEIGDRLHIAPTAHHVLASRHFDQATAHVVVPAAHGVDDRFER